MTIGLIGQFYSTEVDAHFFRFMTFHFMTMDVRATGLKWFNYDGDDILGTGTTTNVFQMVGITPISTNSISS